MRPHQATPTRDADSTDPVGHGAARIYGRPSVARPSRSHRLQGTASRQLKILFVAANPHAGGQLALDSEYRAIEQSIRAGRYRDQFQLIPKLAVRPSDLQQALLEHGPDIVHFACHGNSHAEIMLCTDGAEIAYVSAGALSSIFHAYEHSIALVVFNACFASEQAETICTDINFAIGMQSSIEDSVAIVFAAALYGALAYGRSMQEAFELAVAAIESANPQQKHLPRLFAGEGTDPNTTYFIARPEHPTRMHALIAGIDNLLSGGPRNFFKLLSRVATAAIACLLLGLWWPAPTPGSSSLSSPRSGMVRFSGGSIRLGLSAISPLPPECTGLKAHEGCTELAYPDQIIETHVEAFEIDRVEVTNRDFAAWLNMHADTWHVTAHGILATRRGLAVALVRTSPECGGGIFITSDGFVRVGEGKANWPVVCVTWHGASEYCRAQDKRLPLETEWEFAAKGNSGRPFPWGGSMPKHDGVTFGRRDSGVDHPREVGTSRQDVTPEGVCDLGGNVAEWVDSQHHSDGQKTFRGGSWASRSPCRLLNSSCKHRPAEIYGKDLGFRCASSVVNENLRIREDP